MILAQWFASNFPYQILYKYYIKNFLKNQLILIYFGTQLQDALSLCYHYNIRLFLIALGFEPRLKTYQIFSLSFFIAVRILVERPRVELR